MNIISLTTGDLAITGLLVIALALTSFFTRSGLGWSILIAAFRTTVQLLLIGMVLKALFAHVHIGFITLITFIMLLMAGREVAARQKYRFTGWWGPGVGTASMFISSFTLTLFALHIIVGVEPWYNPQYAIPLLGMMLGNTMSGVTLSINHLTQSSWQRHALIEARLILGSDWKEAISEIQKESIRIGMIPIINAMAAAGVVSLPGMMTGQILSGTPPLEAVKYQIMIMFLIAAGTGFGIITAVWIGCRRLFDNRQRLRLDRLKQ
jgi:putative ABC transport system permease protein